MSKSARFVKKTVLIALLGASLNAVKFSLMFLPNIEAVTLLIALYTYCFGLGTGLSATLVFCVLEGLFWGFNPTWLIAYFIHWPFVSIVAFACKQFKISHPALLALIFGAVTALFGLQSTFIYLLLGGVIGRGGWTEKYLLVYTAGTAFYIAQVVCNLILFAVAFKPLARLLERLGRYYFEGKAPL